MIKKYAMLFVVAGLLIIPVAHAQVDSAAPTVPSGVQSGITQSGQVYVYWTPSTDDVGVVGYYLYRNGGLVANTPGIPDYTDTPSAGTYYYTISAYDAAGNVSAQSAPTPSLTILPDNQAPSTPGNLVGVPSSSSIALSWDASTDNVSVIGYYVYRNGLKIFTTDPITGSSYTDGGLTPGVQYTYSVAAYDAAGNVSTHSTARTVTAIFDVTPPTTPARVSAVAVSPTEVDLSWPPSSDNVVVGGYIINRNGEWLTTTVGTTTITYADTGATPQTTYTYDVIAYDGVGNVSRAASVNISTPPADFTPPSIPGGINAKALDASDVTVSWNPSTDNVSVGGYFVYRDGAQIATLTAASTTYTDSGLSTSTTYTYAVVAYDNSQNVSPQTSVAVTTLSYNPVVPVLPAPVPPAPAPSPSPTPTGGGSTGGATITTNLYYGLRTPDVLLLQGILIRLGDLGPTYGTGFYGSLTQAAVKKFQCAQNIICSGTPGTTGWGSVGPRTRKAVNANVGTGGPL